MASGEQQRISLNQAISQVESITSSTSLGNKMKWKDVCEENAKVVAEKLFASLFIEHSVAIPPDLTLSIIIEQFYQILREKLKQLIQNKISDWEIRYPSLLLATSEKPVREADNKVEQNLTDPLPPEFTSDGGATNQLYLASGISNDVENTSSATGTIAHHILNVQNFHGQSYYPCKHSVLVNYR